MFGAEITAVLLLTALSAMEVVGGVMDKRGILHMHHTPHTYGLHHKAQIEYHNAMIVSLDSKDCVWSCGGDHCYTQKAIDSAIEKAIGYRKKGSHGGHRLSIAPFRKARKYPKPYLQSDAVKAVVDLTAQRHWFAFPILRSGYPYGSLMLKGPDRVIFEEIAGETGQGRTGKVVVLITEPDKKPPIHFWQSIKDDDFVACRHVAHERERPVHPGFNTCSPRCPSEEVVTKIWSQTYPDCGACYNSTAAGRLSPIHSD